MCRGSQGLIVRDSATTNPDTKRFHLTSKFHHGATRCEPFPDCIQSTKLMDIGPSSEARPLFSGENPVGDPTPGDVGRVLELLVRPIAHVYALSVAFVLRVGVLSGSWHSQALRNSTITPMAPRSGEEEAEDAGNIVESEDLVEWPIQLSSCELRAQWSELGVSSSPNDPEDANDGCATAMLDVNADSPLEKCAQYYSELAPQEIRLTASELRLANDALTTTGVEGLLLGNLAERLSVAEQVRVSECHAAKVVQALESFGLARVINDFEHARVLAVEHCSRFLLPAEPSSDPAVGTTTDAHADPEACADSLGEAESQTRCIRPWLYPCGGLNISFLRKVQRKIVLLVMHQPGLARETIVGKMTGLTPQTSIELIDALVTDGVLFVRKAMATIPRTTLPKLLRKRKYEECSSPTEHYFVRADKCMAYVLDTDAN